MTKRYYTMKMLAKAATLAYGHKVSVSPVKKYLRRQGIRPRIVLGQAEGYSELAKESVERHFREEYTAYHVSKIPESMTLEDIERRKQAIRAARLELNKDSDPPRMCRTARVHTSNGGRTERTVRITYAKEAEITKPG